MRCRMLRHTKWLLVALALLPLARSVHAQSSADCPISFRNLSGGSAPELAIISCPFAGNDKDTVYVYDFAGGLKESDRWDKAVSFENEIWIFDAGGDKSANLIIDFHRQGQALVADLYDDRNGDGRVAYLLRNNRPRITESNSWTVRVVAPDGWWVDGGKINFNLNLSIDGPVIAAFAAESFYLNQLKYDGVVDYTIVVRDTDNDGRPDYQLTQAPSAGRTIKTNLMVNEGHNEAPIEGAIFWPFLGTGSVGVGKPYGKSVPPIQVDWSISRIRYVAEFVASRWNDYNWFIYSTNRFGEQNIPYANFENPFAFYDLAQDHDSYPEMAIRMEYYNPYDEDYAYDAPYSDEGRRLIFGRYPYPIEAIRYSWDQDNNRTWDYKVDLVGRNQITDQVKLPGLTVQSVPYDKLPSWIDEHQWDVAVFVAVENVTPAYWTSEGIYTWGATWNLLHRYVPGITDNPPTNEYSEISEGFRGEYSFYYESTPRLYFSPIDRKLHLFGAQSGVWNLGDNQRILYENLNGDGFIDHWAYWQGNLFAANLFQAKDFVILNEVGQITIRRATVPLSDFEAAPPRNNADWEALSASLAEYSAELAPTDFQAMQAQFRGVTYDMSGASLESFQFTGDGFQFFLEVKPGFQWTSPDILPGIGNPAPGLYLVKYNGSWSIEPETCSELDVQPGSFSLDPDQVSALVPTKIDVTLETCGLIVPTDWSVTLYARQGDTKEILAQKPIAVRNKEEVLLSGIWSAEKPGEWAIGIEAEQKGSSQTEQPIVVERQVSVKPVVPPNQEGALLSLDGELPLNGLPILIFMGSMVFCAVILTLILLIARFRLDGETPSDE